MLHKHAHIFDDAFSRLEAQANQASTGRNNVPTQAQDANTGESWKDIPGAPGYQASTSGCIRSVGRHVLRGGKNPATLFLNGRVLRPTRNHASGHLYVSIYRDGKVTKDYVHRLILLTFIGQPEQGHECRHLDGDPGNNKVENLSWGNRSENNVDRLWHGDMPFGEKCSYSKFSDEQVDEIRDLAKSGVPRAELADRFQISKGYVSDLKAMRARKLPTDLCKWEPKA
jgi:hypothetical protein